MQPNFTIEPGTYGPRMIMTGPWSSKAREAVKSGGVKELEVNYAKGWSGDDLSFLTGLADQLEWFCVIDRMIDDVHPVHALTKLRFLDVNTYCKTELDFSRFPRLEECALEWRPKARSLHEHRGVRRVFINKWNLGRDLTDFSGMTQLESLRLYSPTRLESLSGIEHLTGLTWLALALATRLTSLAGVETLTELRHLEVDTCRKIRDLSPVAALRQLQRLWVANCGEIESLRPLRDLRELEQFLFYESTNILDGDLFPLKHLPKLKSVAFMERRHYSLTRQDLPQD